MPNAIVLQNLGGTLHVLLGQVPGQINQVEGVGGPILNVRSGLELEPSRKVQVELLCHKPDQHLGRSVCLGVLDGNSQPKSSNMVPNV